MKTILLKTIFIGVIFTTQSCNSNKPTRTKEAEVIWKLQHDKAQPVHVREGAGIMLDVLNENHQISFRDYFDAKRKVSSLRSNPTVGAWIALLNSTERKLPDSLPSAEQIELKIKESNSRKSRIIYYTDVSRLSLFGSCISALSSFDMPEADLEVEVAIQRFENKYGNTSGGKKMLEIYKTEISQQKETVRMGLAPWQVGHDSSDGCH